MPPPKAEMLLLLRLFATVLFCRVSVPPCVKMPAPDWVLMLLLTLVVLSVSEAFRARMPAPCATAPPPEIDKSSRVTLPPSISRTLSMTEPTRLVAELVEPV